MRTLLRILSYIMIVLVLPSCGTGGEGREAIKADKFAEVYTTLLEEGIRDRKNGLDSIASSKNATKILEGTGVTQEDFQNTLRWYNSDVRRWRPFLDDVVKRLEERANKEGNTPDPSPLAPAMPEKDR